MSLDALFFFEDVFSWGKILTDTQIACVKYLKQIVAAAKNDLNLLWVRKKGTLSVDPNNKWEVEVKTEFVI